MLIAIEGKDRIGKETQSKLLAQALEGKGLKVKLREIPYEESFIKPYIYKMLYNGYAKSFPTLFQTLQQSNRIYYQVTEGIKDQLNYDVVIYDRWKLSSIVYGNLTNVKQWHHQFFGKFLEDTNYPFILDGESFTRDEEPDSYEKDEAFQNNVREEYKKYVNESDCCFLINANQEKEKVHEQIMDKILEYRDLKENE